MAKSFEEIKNKANEKKKEKKSFDDIKKATNNSEKVYDTGTSIKDFNQWKSGLSSLTDRLGNYFNTSSYKPVDDSLDKDVSSYLSQADSMLEFVRGNRSLFKDYSEALSQVYSTKVALEQARGDIRSASSLYSKYDSEEQFTKEREEALAKLKEQEKLRTYDIDSGNKKIEQLKAELEELKTEALPTYNPEDVNLGEGWMAMDGGYRTEEEARAATAFKLNQQAIANRSSAIQALEKKITEEERYLTTAQRTRDAYKLAAVSDPESEHYDPDFEEYAKMGEAIENPSFDDAMYDAKILGFEIGGEEVLNKVKFAKENIDEYEVRNTKYGNEEHFGVNPIYAEVNEKEYKTYNYYLAKDIENSKRGEKTNLADEYLESIEEDLNSRRGVKQGEAAKANGAVFETLFGLAAGTVNNLESFKNYFSDEDYILLSPTQVANQVVAQDMANKGWVADKAYQTASTIGNMLPSILVGSLTGGVGGLVGGTVGKVISIGGQILGNAEMGLSAAGNGYQEMLNLGYSKDQAKTYGTLVGASEATLQYLLGGISSLGGKASGGIITKALSKVDNALGRFAIKYGGNILSEITEEELQLFIEPFLKTAIFDMDYDAPNIDEMLDTAIVTFFSTGLLEGPGAISSEIGVRNDGKAIQKEGEVNRLVELGKTFSVDTVAYEIAKKVDENTGAYTIGRLLNEVNASMSEQNRTDIKNALVKKGVTEAQAETLAKWMNHVVEGGTLSKKQQLALENNDVLAEVLYGTIIQPNSTVMQRGQMYNQLYGIASSMGVDRKALEESQTPEAMTQRLAYKKAVSDELRRGADPRRGLSPELLAEADDFASKYRTTIPEANYQDVGQSNSKEPSSARIADVTERVSDTGAAINKTTGEDVSIKGIASIDTKNKTMMLELADGTKVDSKDIEYESKEQAALYESALEMGYTPQVANSIIRGYTPNSNISVEDYLFGTNEAFHYGWGHIPEKGRTGSSYKVLNKAQREHAVKVGEEARAADDKAREVKAAQKPSPAAKANYGVKVTAKQWEKAIYESKHLNAAQKKSAVNRVKSSIKALDAIAKALKMNIVVANFDGTKHKDSYGYYNPNTNEVVVNINAGGIGKNTLLFTTSHELVHDIRDRMPSKFNVLADFLMEQYSEKGVDIDELIQVEKNKALRFGRNMTYDEAYEEVVAQGMQRFLTDSNFIERLAALQERDASLAKRLVSKLKEILRKIRAAYQGMDTNDRASQAVKEMGEAIDELYAKMEEGLIAASEASQSIGSRNLEDFSEAKNTDGKDLFQYKAMEADEETYRQMLKKHGNMSEKDINKLFSTIDKALVIIKNNLEILDYAWEADIDDRSFSPVKPNSDNLYKVSLDFSTLCRKRILQQVIQTQLQDALNKPLSREESIAIRDELMKIQEEGRQIEIACALCYVESARMKSPAQIKKFLKNRESVIKEFLASKSGGDIKQKIQQAEADARERLGVGNATLKSMPDKIADQIRAAKKEAKKAYTPTAEEQKLIDAASSMTVTDFTSPEGLSNLAKNYPVLFDAYTSFVRNATKSKGIEKDTWWRAGDSDSIGDTLIANMNRENGLRSQSWSDFQVIHMLDYIAATIELSTRNAKEQAYSKVPDYIDLMGNTGVMLNMSLIPMAKFNGKLEYDSVEGMAYKKALELRDKYHATAGTICIGISDEQIKMLLDDSTIDYVIPYHKSGMAAHIRKLMHIPTWSEYEKYQNETNLSRDEAVKQAKKYGVKLLNESDENYQKHTAFSEWFDIAEARQIAKQENAFPTDAKLQKKYGVMYGGYMAMQNAANNYLKLCAERGIAPKFSHENASFSTEANYWKLIIDRKMVDNVTGEIIEQQAIKPIFDEGEVLRILNDELERYPSVKADQDYATRTVVEKFLSGKMNDRLDPDTIAAIMQKPVDNITTTNIIASEEGIKAQYIDRDSDGNELSAEQQEFFKDSKVRDKKGNLLVLYHGTNSHFTIFNSYHSDDKRSFFLTDSPNVAHSYARSDKILNPYEYLDEDTSPERVAEIAEKNVSGWESVKVADSKTVEKANKTVFDSIADVKRLIDAIVELTEGSQLGRSFFMQNLKNSKKMFDSWTQTGKVFASQNPFVATSNKAAEFLNLFNDNIIELSDEVVTALNGLIDMTTPLKPMFDIAKAYVDGGTVFEITDNLGKTLYEGEVMVRKNINWAQSGGLMPLYANINNPLIVEAGGRRWNNIKRLPEMNESYPETLNTRMVSEFASENGYDGVIFKGLVDIGGYSTVKSQRSTIVIAFDSNQLKSTQNKNPTSDPDIRYQYADESLSDRYSYEELTSKPDMKLSLVGGTIPNNRADIIVMAKKNAAKVGKFNPKDGSVSVHVDDIGVDVFLGTDGLKHGLRRKKGLQNNATAIVTLKAGEILKNSIRVNELIPSKENASGSYVLIGAGQSSSGELYVVRFVVNQFSNELTSMDVLYAINAKKELAVLNAPRSTAKPLSVTNSYISIAQLLDFVNNHFPDVLPESVLRHYGYDARPDGELGEDALFQYKDLDAIDNRSLLARSLEGAAKNDIEKTKLKEYKKKIELINAEEKKLRELRAQIKEISFSKGARDTEKLKSLQFEANQAANRINVYDKQLLRLEATKPLMDVVQREKDLVRKKMDQERKAAVKAAKEKDMATMREIMDRHTESRKKAIEGRNKTQMRHKIKNVVGDLNQLLLKGSKERNVKLDLQPAVASALKAINMDTVSADERVAKYDALISKATDPDVIASLTATRDRIKNQGDVMKGRLEALRDAYTEIEEKGKEAPEYYRAEADLIKKRIDSVIQKVGNTPLRDMSLSQLEAVYELYSMVLATVRNANAVFVQGKLEDLQQNASATMEELSEIKTLPEERIDSGWLRSFSWNEMIPVYAFKRMGSQTFEKFFWETIRGQNTVARDLDEAYNFKSETRQKYGYDKWDFNKVHEFKLKDGRNFRITLKHMMSIYAYSKRNQALDHMSTGGFFFNDKETFRKKGGILKFIKKNEVGYCVDGEILETIKAAMTDNQKLYVNEMQEYLTKMGDKGNEVSRVVWGIDIFKEKVYFPLKSVKDFIYQANQPAQESSLKNDGMTKETKPGASNPIVLEAFDEVWAKHVNRMSQYHGLVIPIDNLNKIHNYGTWAQTDSMSVSTMLGARFGEAVNDYLNQFIKDLNGASSTSGATNPFFGLVGKFKKTAVAASTSVVVQQPTAVLRATAVMDAKYFIGMPEMKKLSAKWGELKQYAPVAIIKEIGGFDAGAGRQATEWLNSDTLTGVDKVMNKVDDITMWGAAVGDQIGWCTIWEAVKREIKATTNLKEDSKEFLEKAGERFTEVIVLTQVYDSTLSRSGYMRSKHDSVKMLTSFMGEPTVSVNMMFDATIQAKRGTINKRKAGRIIGATYASIIAASVAASLIYALRDDEDDESYLEKFTASLGGKLIGDINPLNMLPGVRDIISILDGWEVERTDIAIFKDIYDAIDSMDSESKSAWRKVEDISGAFAALFGLPVKNVLRTTREIYNGVRFALDDVQPTGVGSAFVRGLTGKEASKSEDLYAAIMSGDTARLDIYKKEYKTEKAYETAVRKALRNNDPRITKAAIALLSGDVNERIKITKEIKSEGNFSLDTVITAINAEASSFNSTVKKIIEAQEDGDTKEHDKLVKELLDRGYPKSFISDAIDEELEDMEDKEDDSDEASSIYKAADINVALEKGDGPTALKVIDDIVQVKIENYISDGYKKSEAKKKAEASVKSSVSSYWKPLYLEAKANKDLNEVLRIKRLLKATKLYDDVTKTTDDWWTAYKKTNK